MLHCEQLSQADRLLLLRAKWLMAKFKDWDSAMAMDALAAVKETVDSIPVTEGPKVESGEGTEKMGDEKADETSRAGSREREEEEAGGVEEEDEGSDAVHGFLDENSFVGSQSYDEVRPTPPMPFTYPPVRVNLHCVYSMCRSHDISISSWRQRLFDLILFSPTSCSRARMHTRPSRLNCQK